MNLNIILINIKYMYLYFFRTTSYINFNDILFFTHVLFFITRNQVKLKIDIQEMIIINAIYVNNICFPVRTLHNQEHRLWAI